MKTVTDVIALMLTLTFGASSALLAAEPNAAPTATRKTDKASPELKMTGKVTQAGGNSFTVVANGRQHTFVANKLKTLPKVGHNVEVGYHVTPDGAMYTSSVKSSKSNSSD